MYLNRYPFSIMRDKILYIYHLWFYTSMIYNIAAFVFYSIKYRERWTKTLQVFPQCPLSRCSLNFHSAGVPSISTLQVFPEFSLWRCSFNAHSAGVPRRQGSWWGDQAAELSQTEARRGGVSFHTQGKMGVAFQNQGRRGVYINNQGRKGMSFHTQDRRGKPFKIKVEGVCTFTTR